MSLPYKNYIFDLYGTLADIRTDEHAGTDRLRFLAAGGQTYRRSTAACEQNELIHHLTVMIVRA